MNGYVIEVVNSSGVLLYEEDCYNLSEAVEMADQLASSKDTVRIFETIKDALGMTLKSLLFMEFTQDNNKNYDRG